MDVFLLGDLVKLMGVHLLEILDEEFAAFDLFVLGVGFCVKAGDVVSFFRRVPERAQVPVPAQQAWALRRLHRGGGGGLRGLLFLFVLLG